MTSEEEERPRFVTGGYGRHRRQWVKPTEYEKSSLHKRQRVTEFYNLGWIYCHHQIEGNWNKLF